MGEEFLGFFDKERSSYHFPKFQALSASLILDTVFIVISWFGVRQEVTHKLWELVENPVGSDMSQITY